MKVEVEQLELSTIVAQLMRNTSEDQILDIDDLGYQE
jgi:hypothetical protein